jgi:hypothetical protein
VPTNRIITKGILVFIDYPDLMQYHLPPAAAAAGT